MEKDDHHMTGDPARALKSAGWLRQPQLRAALAMLASAGGVARIAGGAVRNGLYGQPVRDIDIATTETPERVMELAEAQGFRTAPTGMAHGTVTLIVGDGAEMRTFEVTTLRRDVETDGRHATVAFTDDWAEDAGRRDLTINALYCDGDGELFDPLGCLPDVTARRVRFVGSAADRIGEDFLRILRFFRFHADYAEGAMDAEGLEACARLRAGLKQLSGERIWAELPRIVTARGAEPVVARMHGIGLFTEIFGAAVSPASPAVLSALIRLEAALELEADAVLRFGALCVSTEADVAGINARLKLANVEADRLRAMAALAGEISPALSHKAARALIYRHGAESFGDALLFCWARSGNGPEDIGLRALSDLSRGWPAPEFPLTGKDLRALGVEQGPQIGELLKALEADWVANDFATGEADLRKHLAAAVKAL